MQLWLVVLGLCALSSAAPQNWPYRDSLMPYRYGYPGQSQYKYLPEVEDDEDTGPYLSRLHGRQDLVVGSEGDRVKPTSETGVSSVIETGSVPPVVEPNKNPRPPQAASPTHKPVGVDTGRPVQPPPFPAARPPPTPPPPAKPDEEEEDDESEEDADDDVEAEDEEADDGEPDADADEEEAPGDNEDDEEEERRRQEPLNIKSEKVVESKPTPVAPVVPVVPSTVAPVVPVNQTAVNATVPKPSGAPDAEEDASSEEHDSPGIEALVPGYVTDQGEVLVPVDTVTGDQPIAIVPDPYGQPARGVALNRQPSYRGPYEESDDYENPYYYSDIYGGLRRQEDSDEIEVDVDSKPSKGQGKVPVVASEEKNSVASVENVDEQETDDEEGASEGSTKDKDSLEAELEGRNEYMTAFPPSRTPELFAYINSRIPVDSNSEYEYDEYVQQQSGEYQGPYAYQQQIRQQPRPRPYYTQRPRPQSPSVTLAVALSGNNQQQVPYNRRYQQQQQSYSQYPYGSYEDSGEEYRPVPSPFYRRPVPSMYRPNQFSGYQQRPVYRPNQFSGYQQGPIYRPNQFSGYQQGPIYRPNQFSGYQQQFGGYQQGGYNRPNRPYVGYGQGGPSFYRPRPNVVARPVGGQGVKHAQGLGYLRPTAVRITPVRKPTPVIKQKKQPESQSLEMPYGFGSDSADVSSGGQDSYEQPKYVERKTAGKNTVVKSRRAAKMAKKPNKKLLEPKKATSDPDPLNILKKIHAKRS